MKKYLISSVVAIMMVVGLFPVQAMAGIIPSSPGLWVEGVQYSIKDSTGQTPIPDGPNYINNNATVISNISNQTVTINVPISAKTIMFRYWDYGNPNGISPPNNGWIIGGESYLLNGENVRNQHISIGSDGRRLSSNKLVAIRNYITYNTSLFPKTDNTDTYKINVYRVVGAKPYQYSITYNINWVNPAPTATYDGLNHWLTDLNGNMKFRFTAPNNMWYSWLQCPDAPLVSFNMYPYLSTSRITEVEVKWSADEFAPTQRLSIPALKPAPSGLYIDYYTDGKPVIWGFNTGKYYAFSTTPEFDEYVYVAASNGGGIYVDNVLQTVNPGDTVYVRTADNINSAASAYVALTVPPLPAATNALTNDLEARDLNLSIEDGSKIITADTPLSVDTDSVTITEEEVGTEEYASATSRSDSDINADLTMITYEDGTKSYFIQED